MVDYHQVINAMKSGDLLQLEQIASLNGDFPTGRDPFFGRTWIINAIDSGTLEVVKWMIEKAATINDNDEEGFTPLHSALYRDPLDRYQVIELLCKAGANVNVHGIHDWTPLHMAAALNDVEAIHILLKYGADNEIRTRIDNYATAYEEAIHMNAIDAAKALERIHRK